MFYLICETRTSSSLCLAVLYIAMVYFAGPPPARKRTPHQKISVGRYNVDGTGRDLMSLFPVPRIMPYTAKVYHALKPVSNRVAPKTYGAERPKPSGSGRDSFVWKHWDNNKPPGFRPTETPWARNSTAPWANDRMAKRPPKKRLNYNAKSAEAKRQRQKFIIQQQYMKILTLSPRQQKCANARQRPNTSQPRKRSPRHWPMKPNQGPAGSIPRGLRCKRPETPGGRNTTPWV